jgi:hypothetical protein
MSRSDWKRVSRARPCPICSKSDWCLLTGPDDSPSAAICARVESDKRVGDQGAGWLHVLRNDGPTWPEWKRTVHIAARRVGPATPGETTIDFHELTVRAMVSMSDVQRERFAEGLGVSAHALWELCVGWLPDRRAWTFPMSNAEGDVTGIRLRLPNGRKLSIKGGKEGLFVPTGLKPGGRLLVCEGATDCAALLDLGFSVIGRPSCTGGTKHLVELVKRLKPVEVAIVADHDEPGQRGADRLAVALLAYVPIVRVVVPPPGVKDAREWKRAGATAADVHLAIQAATPKTLKIRVSPKHEKASLRSRP